MKLVIIIVLNVLNVFSYVTEPILKDLRNGHTIVKQDINLECIVTSNRPEVTIKWNAPLHLNLSIDRINITSSIDKLDKDLYKIKSFYTIRKSGFEDSSVYYCTAVDAQDVFNTKYKYIWVPVYEVDEHVIQFHKELTVFNKANLEIEIYAKAHPEAKFYWSDNNNKRIQENFTKFTTKTNFYDKFTNYQAILKFSTLNLKDLGNYSIVAQNHYETKIHTILVNITAPSSTMTVETRFEQVIIGCQSVGFPKPKIEWQFERCSNLGCFGDNHQNEVDNIIKSNYTHSEETGGLQIRSFIFITPISGLMKCISRNEFGINTPVQPIYIVENDFEVFSKNLIKNNDLIKVEALFNENVEIMCAVSLNDYHNEIKWFKSGRNFSLDDVKIPMKGFDEYHIRNFDTVYSSVSVLKINIDKTDEGDYFCKASKKDGAIVSKVIRVEVREQALLNVASNMKNDLVLMKYGVSCQFYCHASGYPTPFIKWFKNNVVIEPSERIKIGDNNQTLSIHGVLTADNGTYTCVATNRYKNDSRTAILGITEKDLDWLLITIILLVVILLTLITIKMVKIYIKWKIESRVVGLVNCERTLEVENV